MLGGRNVLFHSKLGREPFSSRGILALVDVPSRQSGHGSRGYSRTHACHHYVSFSSSHCGASVTPENGHLDLVSLDLLSSWIPCVLRFYLGWVLWTPEVLFFSKLYLWNYAISYSGISYKFVLGLGSKLRNRIYQKNGSHYRIQYSDKKSW